MIINEGMEERIISYMEDVLTYRNCTNPKTLRRVERLIKRVNRRVNQIDIGIRDGLLVQDEIINHNDNVE